MNFFLMLIRYNPTSVSLSIWWNLGSLLFMMMVIQIVSGFLLIQFYSYSVDSFSFTQNIMLLSASGYVVRLVHMNFVSWIFVFMYFHVMKGIYLNSWKLVSVWLSAVTILMIMMMVSFFAYTLPNSSMSFWGVTVIFNLITVIPNGGILVYWLWSAYFVNNYTIGFIFSLHYIVPFILMVVGLIHILYLHKYSSTNSLAITSNYDKINFYPMYSSQDMMNLPITWILLMMVMMFPYTFIDVEMMIKMNMMMSPVHIQPEWYFLPFYSILRVVPSKLGGVMCFLLSVCILYMFPLMKIVECHLMMMKLLLVSMLFWLFIALIWIGMSPVEYPFMLFGSIFSLMYFIVMIMI